jgi:large subunit ribosomal protein L30
MAQIVVIRLRGRTGLHADVEETLRLLNLFRVNNCTILEDKPEIVGMIKKAKDYITWGTIDDATLALLIQKHGELMATPEKKAFVFNGKNYKPTFRLNPAKGGLGRRGIKAPFSKSGALGNRKEKINELIKTMMRV